MTKYEFYAAGSVCNFVGVAGASLGPHKLVWLFLILCVLGLSLLAIGYFKKWAS